MQTVESSAALAAFTAARDKYLETMRSVPPGASEYLKPGDDYSLGGIAVHVNYVLEHYTNVLDALLAGGFAECRPEDPAGLEGRAKAIQSFRLERRPARGRMTVPTARPSTASTITDGASAAAITARTPDHAAIFAAVTPPVYCGRAASGMASRVSFLSSSSGRMGW